MKVKYNTGSYMYPIKESLKYEFSMFYFGKSEIVNIIGEQIALQIDKEIINSLIGLGIK